MGRATDRMMRVCDTEVMDEVAQNVPSLEKIVSEIDGLAESGGKYVEAPHVIEVTLPMLCRFTCYMILVVLI